MRIVHLVAEFAPLAKAGGLGEVAAGLSKELSRMGENVEVIIPKYDFIDMTRLKNVDLEVPDFKCVEGGGPHANAMWSAECSEVKIKLLEARHAAGYFHRGRIYGEKDDADRFLYFTRACLEYLKLKGEPIDVLHLHDWHVAAAAPLVRGPLEIPVQRVVLTIHNAGYQGKCLIENLEAAGLSAKDYFTPEKMQDGEDPGLVNLLKGGIVYADSVVLVSPTYAREVLTPEHGHGLEETFRKMGEEVSGILNGLDQEFWNPGSDPFLKAHYVAQDGFQGVFLARKKMREELHSRFDLKKRPWIGAITRLVQQKGPKLIEEAIAKTVELGGSFFLLGSSPEPELQSHFEALKEQYEGQSALLHLEFDEALAHQLYAALDFLVLPSLFEPCGLSQMIAMRYGTIPVARAVGGHVDTIFDWANPDVPEEKRNGLLFSDFTKEAMAQAVCRAHDLFKHQSASIEKMIENGMAIDWSWKSPAQEYLRLYQKLS